jgi:hypothetical protein
MISYCNFEIEARHNARILLPGSQSQELPNANVLPLAARERELYQVGRPASNQ